MPNRRLIPLVLLAVAIGGRTPAFAQDAAKTPLSALTKDQAPEKKAPEDPDPALTDAINTELPADPSAILELAKRLSDTMKAAQHPYGSPPKIENGSRTLNVTPGAGATEIYLAAGYPTDLTFVDSTGQPWPVEHIGIGLKDKLSAEITTPDGPTVEITPNTPFPMPLGLSITLKGLVQPVQFRLTTGEQPFVNMAFTARIPQYGPAAKIPLIDKRDHMVASDPILETVLDGQPPQGSTRLRITGADDATSAWLFDGSLYLRTRHALLSPRYDGITRSPDGMTAYSLRDIRVVTLSIDGTPTLIHMSPTVAASNGR